MTTSKDTKIAAANSGWWESVTVVGSLYFPDHLTSLKCARILFNNKEESGFSLKKCLEAKMPHSKCILMSHINGG